MYKAGSRTATFSYSQKGGMVIRRWFVSRVKQIVPSFNLITCVFEQPKKSLIKWLKIILFFEDEAFDAILVANVDEKHDGQLFHDNGVS